jgi:hypothetical protein
MDAVMSATATIGIVAYAGVVLAMAILALDCWERGAPRRMVALLILWGLIALLQLLGLVATQAGSADVRLWYVNRLFWFVFAVLALSMAWRAFRSWVRRMVEAHISQWLWPENGDR